MKNVLRKSNLVAGVLVLTVVCLGIVFAGDVVVKEGTITVDEITADVFKDGALVGYWQFNGNATDSWMHANHGTFAGDAHAQKGVLELDGGGDYVHCENADSLNLTNSFSISAWFNLDSRSTGIIQIVCKGDRLPRYSDGAYAILVDGDLGFNVRNSDNNGYEGVETAVTANEWTHVVGTFSNGDMRLYKNGDLVDSDSLGTSTIWSNDDRLGIGAEGDGRGCFWGSIDDVMILDRALESWEIQQLYNKDTKRYGYFLNLYADTFDIAGDLIIPGTIEGGSITTTGTGTFGRDGVGLLDIEEQEKYVYLKCYEGSLGGSNRNLILNVDENNRTITLLGDPTLNDWFDQSVKAAASPTFDGETISADGEINFRDTDISIGSTLADGILDVSADTSIRMFYDNADVGNPTDGQIFEVWRRAGEQDGFLKFYTDQYRRSIINTSFKTLLQVAGTTKLTLSADGGLLTDKLAFTQGDLNEYIDSLADGYMDYGATTAHRFNNDIDIANTKVLKVNSTQVVGTQQAHIADADNSIAAAAGDPPTKAEFDALVTAYNDLATKFNALLTYLDADAGHGLLAGTP